MPGGMYSSRYSSATTSPGDHSVAPVLHCTLSPILKRRFFSLAALDSGVTAQERNAALSASWSRFFPMKTILLMRSWSGCHLSMKLPLKIMCTAWYTNCCSECSMESTPFIRKISAPFSCRILEIQSCTLSRSRSPLQLKLQLLTELSCTCSPSVSRNSGSFSSVRFRSNPWMLSTESTLTSALAQRRMGAKLLIDFSRSSTRTRSASETRSVLLRSIRSAKATCSTASFSAPSGFSSSRCCSMCFASISVTIPSRRANSLTASSTKKVCATGAGSAMPVVSITIPSSLSLPDLTRFASLLRTTMRSCRTVQQMQPFIISMISSSACILVFFERRASSMPISPNSFSMTAIFFPCVAVRIWFSNVVFPLPRKPVSTVTGTL
mmetsp:Transcript_22019/g.49678  ORF Transcript_22019/g.49678 Transcript_22019/m.49678 type:complete len:381 (+) Transcript_22019:595-1737(+)